MQGQVCVAQWGSAGPYTLRRGEDETPKGGKDPLPSAVSTRTGWPCIHQGKAPSVRNLSPWYVSYL